MTADGGAIWQNVGPAQPWVASNPYTAPSVVLDSNNNLQLVTSAGTSGATVPSWNASFAGTTTDSGVTWTNIGPGLVIAYSGYNYIAAYRTVTGNLSSASPVLSTGPIKSSVSAVPISITAWSITSNVATFIAGNTLIAGTAVKLTGFTGAGNIFNGFVGAVSGTGLSSSQFELAFTHANGSGSDSGFVSPVFAVLGAPASGNSETTATATITSVQVASGVVTVTAANNFTQGLNVRCNGLGSALFLNGTPLEVTSATPTQFTFSLPDHADYGPTSDSGTATFLGMEFYRTEDGGGVYYFDGACATGETFSDIAQDGDLDAELICPFYGSHLNDPPPGQVGSTQSIGGTIIAWWSNRIWMAVGNLLYFSGGPDILNGIPEECFPPANVFVFPGVISALNPTTGGLVVTIPEEVWAIVGGPQTTTYYPERILTKFGALSPNCVIQDGDNIYAYSSGRQLTALTGGGKQELGAGGSGVSPVGDILANGMATLSVTASAWSPTASYLTIHRQGEDSGIYLSNGVESIIRYGLNVGNFSPVRQPFVNGAAVAGAINSVETAPGQYSLLFGPTTTQDYIYARNLTTFTDNGNAYDSNAVIGNIVVTEPGQPLAPLQFIAAYLFNRGSVPLVSFVPNDILPTSFVALSTVQNEPAFLTAPISMMNKRWPVIMNQTATPILLRHLQVKIDFGNTDTVKNELIELALRFDNEQMV